MLTKSMKQRAVRDTTIRSRINQLNDLHEILTNVDINCFFAEQFTGPLAAILIVYQVTFQSVSTWFGHKRLQSQQRKRSDTKRSRGAKPKLRYKQCGKEFGTPEWALFHVINHADRNDMIGTNSRIQFLVCLKGDTSHERCTVLLSNYEPRLPRLWFYKRLPKKLMFWS